MKIAFALILLLPLAAAASPWPDAPLRGANIVERTPEADVRALADWGANVARIQPNGKLFADQPPHALDEKELGSLFETIDRALDAGLYVVFSPVVDNDDHDGFFKSKPYRKALRLMWEKVAARYAADKRGLAYDLLNEPHDKEAEKRWSGYARELTRAIRKLDKDHTIVVEPPGWGWPEGFEHLTPTGDANTVYSFHFYGPMDFTHQRGYDEKGNPTGTLKATPAQWKERAYPGKVQGEYWDKAKLDASLAKAYAFRDKHKVRIWCGEFGVARWAVGAEDWFRDMVDVMEAQKIGWAYYSFREWQAMDVEMDPAVVDAKTPRGDTPLSRLVRGYFKKNAGQ